MAKSDRKLWNDPGLNFYCKVCRSTENNDFDYKKGLSRLSVDAYRYVGYEQLVIGVRREKLLMKAARVDRVESSMHRNFNNLKQDPVSNAILSEYYFTGKVALASSGNGNCLFNAVSILLAGDEIRATELRYRCTIEMVSNRDKMQRNRQFNSVQNVSGDYEKACVDFAHDKSWGCMWNVMALSYVLNVKIEVVYPAVNGTDNYNFKAMNTTFRPPFTDPDKPTMTVMWTSVVPPKRRLFNPDSDVWKANHFVPLVSSTQKRQEIELVADDIEY